MRLLITDCLWRKQRNKGKNVRRLGIDIADAIPADRDVESVVEMMLDAMQRFADATTQERPFGWHAVKLLREGSARSTRGGSSRRNPLQLSSSTARTRANTSLTM
jgi:hypothetical protein